MAAHNELGKWGEQVAAEFLMKKGYQIMFRDWKIGRRDLDIIARKDDVVVIVEVRTRRNNHFGDTEMTINRQKVRNLCIASNAFVKQLRIDNEVRFDIVAITGTPDTGYTINHMEDALRPHLSW
ncbi:MAG: YraN family protein [Prevotella sp.]